MQPGDVILVSGDVGRHGMAIMAVREGLQFESPIESDCAALAAPVLALLDAGIEIHCLRDLTRGGLASALNEIAETAGVQIDVEERAVPVAKTCAARARFSASTRSMWRTKAASWRLFRSRTRRGRWPSCARSRWARKPD